MKVSTQIVRPLRFRSEVHIADPWERRLPDTWVEAREQVAVCPFDETQTIGEVFDRAIAKVSHRVARDRKKMRGIPCIRGTRIPVYQVCGLMAEGMSLRKTARALYISEEQARTAIRFASLILEQ